MKLDNFNKITEKISLKLILKQTFEGHKEKKELNPIHGMVLDLLMRTKPEFDEIYHKNRVLIPPFIDSEIQKYINIVLNIPFDVSEENVSNYLNSAIPQKNFLLNNVLSKIQEFLEL